MLVITGLDGILLTGEGVEKTLLVAQGALVMVKRLKRSLLLVEGGRVTLLLSASAGRGLRVVWETRIPILSSWLSLL